MIKPVILVIVVMPCVMSLSCGHCDLPTCGLSESQSLTVQSAPADRNACCTWLLQARLYTASEWPAKLCWYLDERSSLVVAQEEAESRDACPP